MDDKEFDDLKKKVLPIPLQEHFSKNKKVFQTNIQNYQNMMNELSSVNATDEAKSMIALTLDMGQALYGSVDVLLEHTEIAFFGLFTLREEIDNIKDSLERQGIKIDNLLKYENGLKFVDDYIKHSSQEFKP